MSSSGLVLTLFSRRGCPACEELLAELEMGVFPVPFDIHVVDIDDDTQLVEKYGTDVPVLMAKEVELGRHDVDIAQVVKWMQKRA